MSKRPTAFARVIGAIVDDEARALRLIRATPAIAEARASVEYFVEDVHQLYAGDTALHLAAAALRPRVVEALIGAGADPNAVNRRGAIALHYACDARPRGAAWNPDAQRTVIGLLLDAGSDIEQRDKSGAAPLHRAVRARSPEAVRCLLARGALVNAAHGRRGSTPLHLGMRSTGASSTKGTAAEQRRIVELLLHYGADARESGAVPRT